MQTIEELIELAAKTLGVPERVIQAFHDLPWQSIEALYKAALEAGEKPGKAADKIAHVLDQLVDFKKVLPGAKGEVLEMADGPALRFLVALVLRFGLKRA